VGFDADFRACAALVQNGDPDRFLAAMAAPVVARPVLFALYAFNVEIARAPWVTREAMIAEMRLQWWRDAIEEIAQGKAVRRHEVTTAMAAVLTPERAAELDEMIVVRQWDIYKDPFRDAADFARYIDQSAGTLMWAAARALGPADEAVVRDFAFASGLANWFRAIPALEARGRLPLPDGRRQAVQALARDGLARLERARAARRRVSGAAGAALLAGWQTAAVLRQVADDPRRVADGALGQSEARKRLTLMARAASGRW
jgi:15-cis-phytoene synthase